MCADRLRYFFWIFAWCNVGTMLARNFSNSVPPQSVLVPHIPWFGPIPTRRSSSSLLGKMHPTVSV